MIEKKKIIKEVNSWIFSILGAFLLVALLNSKVFATVVVQQSSMDNTLYSDQKLILDKLSYNLASPKRGDIIIFLKNKQRGTIIQDAMLFINNVKSKFKNTDSDIRLVKRVIAIPGDEINIKDGYVYINGEKLEEAYVKGETFSGEFELPISVPDDKLFVLGDNRIVSEDSRRYGLINCNQIEGKAVFRISPFNKIGTIK
jgi:signal peptidase I